MVWRRVRWHGVGGHIGVVVVGNTGGDAEGGNEDVEEHHKVEEVGGHVLPERDLPERQSLLLVLLLLSHEEGVVLLHLCQLQFRLSLVLLPQCRAVVLTSPRQLRLHLLVAWTLLEGVFHYLWMAPL